jgi:hypothetical protein
MNEYLRDPNSILDKIDLEIAIAGARENPIDTIVINETDYKQFCKVVGYKDNAFTGWPVYRGLTVMKQTKGTK